MVLVLSSEDGLHSSIIAEETKKDRTKAINPEKKLDETRTDNPRNIEPDRHNNDRAHEGMSSKDQTETRNTAP